ncbi:hypothetical protein C8J57DRAFT_1528508 [Mycena rebaudengoi]|nr:hypothetical protein C8J57DRAFT_1528508 [Mycena rebaudengoi]
MVAWSDVSRCTNRDCKWNDSCRKFCPPSPAVFTTEHALLMAVCMCGCFGLQHQDTSARAAAGSGTQAGANGRVPFTSVSEGARERKARQTDEQEEEIYYTDTVPQLEQPVY